MHLPGPPGDDKLFLWHVVRVEGEMISLDLHLVKLRINRDPALLGGIPILTDPMVAIVKVGREATACPYRNASMTQQHRQHRRKISTVAHESVARRTRNAQWAIIDLQNTSKHARRWTDIQ